MAKDVLFEIGVEELPAGYMPNLLSQLSDLAKARLDEAHLSYEEVTSLGTPRRLALQIKGVAETSADIHERHKGPSAAIAFDGDGKPTKAAMGFARGKGISVEALVVEDGYIYAETTTQGLAADKVLAPLLQSLLTSLSFPKSMHWGSLDEKFARPVRWLVALFGTEVLPVTFAGIMADRYTRGHRFLGSDHIALEEPAVYEKALEENYVIVDQHKRKAMIEAQLAEIAKANEATLVEDADLLEEILYLVEYPTALCGGFDASYLELPAAAVVTPMKDHQRYFPLVDKEGKLLPKFVTVRNGDSQSLDVVQAGNERVLRARLDDAKFFFKEDCKKPLAERTEGLTKIVFQEGLGNLLDKSERLLALGQTMGELCELSEEELFVLERATVLAKTDLTTGMVTEFTELQGVMGKEYALLDGESKEVAEAIFEQYLPRFAGDILPVTGTGKVLSIVDKVDNIVATFSRGLIPTGSQDPYALRRQTIGILNILTESGWNVSLVPLFEKAMELLQVAEDKQGEILEQLEKFVTLRLRNIFLDKGYPYNLVDFVLANPEATAASAEGMLAALQANRLDEKTEVLQAFTRIYNLVKEVPLKEVDTALCLEACEKALHEKAQAAYEEGVAYALAENYEALLTLPETLTAEINAFFEGVMVMDKDEAIKQNRLQLLRLTYEVMRLIGDVSCLK